MNRARTTATVSARPFVVLHTYTDADQPRLYIVHTHYGQATGRTTTDLAVAVLRLAHRIRRRRETADTLRRYAHSLTLTQPPGAP